jgi:hypothetical protein
VAKRDETSVAVVEAARELFARWARQGRDAGLTIIVNPINRLFWRRWRIVEGFDVRVGCNRNPPPAGLVLGGHRAVMYPVRERSPFTAEWTNVEDLDCVVATIERQLAKWTGA